MVGVVGLLFAGVLSQTALAPVGGAAGRTHSAVVFSDTFSKMTGPDKGLGTGWTLISGLWYSTGAAVSDLDGANQAQGNVSTCLNCQAQVTVIPFGVEAGVYLRAPIGEPTSHYDFVLLPNGHLEIRRWIGGVPSVLGDVASGLTALDSQVTLALKATGTGVVALSGSLNGKAILAVTDATPSALSAVGYAGIWTTRAGVPFDNFTLSEAAP